MRPSLNVMDEEQIELILADAREILARVGIEVRGSLLRRRLLDHGLRAGENGRILFPPSIIEQTVASAPEVFTLYDRGGAAHARLGGDQVHFVPGSSGLNVLDRRSGEMRRASTADFVEYVRLADSLSHIAYLATAFSTNDIEESVSDAWRLYLCLTNSKKPVVSGAFTEHGVPRMVEMMQLFRDGTADLIRRPLSIFTVTPTGNFRYSEDSCQNLLDCAAAGIPIEITPVTLMGLVAPVTLLEATVFHTVDVLAGLAMAQIIRPGTPVLFGGAPAVFHMQLATSPMSAIEAQKLNMAYVAVAKHLGLPTQAYMALSDSKTLDAQAGAETYSSALLAALAGINSVSGPGMLDYVMLYSPTKLVLDDELCGQALHFVRENREVGETQALDLARELLNEKHLLTAEHTRRHWPDQLYLPGRVIDRQNREGWLEAGSLSLNQRAAQEVDRRLAAYVPVETEPQIIKELRRLIVTGTADRIVLPQVPVP